MTLKRVERGIYVRASGIYYILYQNEVGRIVWKSTKQKSLKAARQFLEKHKTDVAMKVHLPNRRYESVKFSELADHWWNREGSRSASQWNYLIPRIRERFGKCKARRMTSDEIQDFLDTLRETLSASSVNHHRTILNRIFNFALERKTYDHNPVKGVPQYREPPGRDRFPTVEEFKKLINACDPDIELRTAILVYSMTTLRKSELLRRRWTEVHLDAQVPYVSIPITKNHDPKKVPLPAIAVEALRILPSYGKSEFLFPSRPTARFPKPRKPYMWDLGKRFKSACAAAELENLRIHDLRHMGASILTEQGIAPEIIRKITGHRGKELDRYQHLSERLKSQTVDLIADVLFKKAGEVQSEESDEGGGTIH